MEKFIFDLSLVIVSSALLSYLAILLKQPIIIGYIVCGVLIGPFGLGLIKDVEFIEVISHLGITLLLFLAGLCLHPQKLIVLFKKTALITVANCAVSFGIAFLFAFIFKYSLMDSLCIGLALMFSSTILVVKLLPTTRLHQERMGALCISVLILQDILAVVVLAFIKSIDASGHMILNFGFLLIKLIVFIGILFLIERFILQRIMGRLDRIHESLFIIGLAWCFGIASVSNYMGLFYEIGAFFAGVVLARHRISFFISESLKPLRDFFLVLFFFTLGAKLDIRYMSDIIIPSVMLAVIFIGLKPLLFKGFFLMSGENKEFSSEIGLRLGQLSEFSLLIAILAFDLGHIGKEASQLIQFTTIFTLIASSYFVIFKYPTPIGVSEKLIRD